jgi:hypothetical protein
MKTGLHDYVLRQLETTDLSYQEVANGAKMSKRTVEKIARREIEDPGVSHVEKLATFFRKREQRAAA